MKKRKFWGWGYEDQLLTEEEDKSIERRIAQNFSLDEVKSVPIPKAEEIELPKSRVSIPSNLSEVLTEDHLERLNHSYGKSFPDIARSILGIFPSPPDLVAYPKSQTEVESTLDWADQNLSLIHI